MPLTLAPPPAAVGLDADSVVQTAADVADRVAEAADRRDATRAFPAEEFGWLSAAGLLTAPLPPALGGLGLGGRGARHALYRVLAEVGRGSLPVGRVYEGHVNALDLVMAYGNKAQRERAAEDAHAGHVFGVWNTEGAGGVRLAPTDGGGARLEGVKTFCSGAGHVTRAFANGAWPDGGWQMVLVDLDGEAGRAAPGSWTAEGMRASQSGRVDFSGLEVGPDALVGQPGDYTREPDFTGGAVRFAAVQLGGAQALLGAAVAWLRRLDRTGDPHQRARVGRAAIAVETGALWLLGAARLWEAGAAPDAVVAYAQMTRTAVERACLDVLELVDRSVGARGLLPPSAVERVGRDLRLYLRQPAPDAALDAAAAAALAHPGLALGSAPDRHD
jgi:alkylation response protein AidB-like acyl-CoA dehydrogenase